MKGKEMQYNLYNGWIQVDVHRRVKSTNDFQKQPSKTYYINPRGIEKKNLPNKIKKKIKSNKELESI